MRPIILLIVFSFRKLILQPLGSKFRRNFSPVLNLKNTFQKITADTILLKEGKSLTHNSEKQIFGNEFRNEMKNKSH